MAFIFMWKIMRGNMTDEKGETDYDRNKTFIL